VEVPNIRSKITCAEGPKNAKNQVRNDQAAFSAVQMGFGIGQYYLKVKIDSWLSIMKNHYKS
jgi:hypothetical protein